MDEYTATVRWERDGAKFTDNRYSRVHQWEFDGGASVPASASPHVVREPFSSAAAVDPEEAFVVALSSCHMLWFLSLAAKRGVVVDSYVDRAVGYMEKNERGKLAITRVVLRPEIRFGGTPPSEDEIRSLHHEAHEECFLANSVRTMIEVGLSSRA